jgi:gamma-glutamylputrescine oxidase
MSRNSASFWMDDAAHRELIPPTAPTLRRAIDADVAVVGGGFAGLSSAIEIARSSPTRQVVLVEAQRVGFGASGRCAGMVVPLVPQWFVPGTLPRLEAEWATGEVLRRFEAVAAALGLAGEELRPARLYVAAPSSFALQALRWVRQQLADLDVSTELLSAEQSLERTGEHCKGSLGIPVHATHPALLALRLRELAENAQVTVHEHTGIARIESSPDAVILHGSDGARIRARRVVLASGAWDIDRGFFRNPGKVRYTWMLATAPLPTPPPGGDSTLVGDLSRAGMYRRLFERRLLLGGFDDTVARPLGAAEIPSNVLPRLRRLTERSLPQLGEVDVQCVWGGPCNATRLQLPWVRKAPTDPRVVAVSGLAGSGIAWGLLAGQLVRGPVNPDLDDAADERLRRALSASRLPVGGALRLGARLLARALMRA